MIKEWIKLVVATAFEVGWVVGLKHAENPMHWAGTVFAIIVSFYLLIQSGKKLPVGTAYAVFTGLGTAGTVMAEIFMFNEPLLFSKVGLILILLAGVIGLKMLTPSESKKEGRSA
ncbi:DMT family transporter [Halobacillus massiliensis]|uniref:DMT family transporter n=1 Tax=Halobacillus massiliensis TaxID=1926286 RepID=UPI0009E4D0B5|nr:multidrug efflux SMR transporter [Halobacillus massiliensis]